MFQLLGGVVGGKKCPKISEAGQQLASHGERDSERGVCGQPEEWPHLSSSNQGMTDCAMPVVLLPPTLQKVEVGDLFLGFLSW